MPELFADGVFRLVHNSTHNSLQAYASFDFIVVPNSIYNVSDFDWSHGSRPFTGLICSSVFML